MIKTIESASNNDFIMRILKGTFMAILITIVSLTLFSIILTYSKVEESVIPVITIIISAVSVFIAGSLTSSNIRKNGMITGGAVGLIYILVIYLLSSIITKNFLLNTHSLIMIIATVLSGGIGGIFGVNIKK